MKAGLAGDTGGVALPGPWPSGHARTEGQGQSIAQSAKRLPATRGHRQRGRGERGMGLQPAATNDLTFGWVGTNSLQQL